VPATHDFAVPKPVEVMGRRAKPGHEVGFAVPIDVHPIALIDPPDCIEWFYTTVYISAV
jgi:hypothetical protein